MSDVSSDVSFREGAGRVWCDKAVKLLHARTGIVLGEHKVASTQRILHALSERFADGDPAALLHVLDRGENSDAWTAFINAFTINHTAFFREPHHFLRLEEFFRSRPQGCSVWCAAASTGEEPYSIAMVAQEVYESARVSCSILATDIDTDALGIAQTGVYALARADSVGQSRLKRHFLRGVGSHLGKAKIRSSVQERVSFASFNLNAATWPAAESFDVVFCRNTMIYFDRPTQQQLLKNFARVIRPGGLLFIGHSESITQLTNAFSLLGQTVYQRHY